MQVRLILIVLLISSPAFAQVDFSGMWVDPVNVDNPSLGEYMGVPLNDSARQKAETWSESIQTQPELQCIPHGGFYIWHGFSNVVITKELDPTTRDIVAFNTEWDRSVQTP